MDAQHCISARTGRASTGQAITLRAGNECNRDFSPIATGSRAIVQKGKSFEWIFRALSVNSMVTRIAIPGRVELATVER
jgi:hypothetical protein